MNTLDSEAIVLEEPDQLVARCGAILVWVSRNKLEDAPFAHIRDALEQHARNHPEGVALLLIATGEVELKASNRRRIVRGLSSLEDRLQAVAAVFEGDKPWLTHTRALFDGILAQVDAATGGPHFPMRAFSDRLDALVWLGGVVLGDDQRPIETDALTEIVELATARLNAT